ncbi:MAG: 1-acyl-sn-glycerol-3-phosphate acyltransferase, partial [Lactobacillus sp.]|nr:1-acyl-sn-glycerol-3-phosphate acyltransferase [Lactobacillus sp.]
IHLLKGVRTLTSKNAHIVIYPEAHVWPYYTEIRPFPETSFNFPVQANKASFVMSTTYQKRKFSKRPKITVYIDGPFFPDPSLPKKQQQKKLHDQVFQQLKDRSKLSDYSYYQYQQRKIGG